MSTLAQAELVRYSRHLILPDVGVPGQEKLKAARVLLIGAGGLGSPAALYLAAAGVGTLGLVDFDNVDVTNLQRQILHGTKDVGRPKLVSARERIVGIGEPLAGRLLLIDTLGMEFRTVRVRKDPTCPACGTREIRSLIDYEQFCGLRAAEAEPRSVGGFVEVTPRELQSRLSRGE